MIQIKAQAKSAWQVIKRNWQQIPRLNSAFCFFDLEVGCKLIALFGALVSLVRIFWVYYLVYRSDIRSLFTIPQWIYIWLDGKRMRLCYHHMHYQFRLGLYFVTMLNSMLLFLGIKWSDIVFLCYWIGLSIFTWTMIHFCDILGNFKLSQSFYTIPSICLDYYLILVVLSLIHQIGEKRIPSEEEIEEPDIEMEE